MVEIIPKPIPKLPFWQTFFSYFAIILLVLSLLSYLFLHFSLQKTSQILGNLEETLAREKTPAEIALETKVFGYQKKIATFSQLMTERKKSSKIFPFLEKICHPQVWFQRVNLSLETLQVEISGESENFQVLGQQLLILKKEPLIKDLNLSKIAFGKEGKANFTISFTFSPAILK